MHVSRLTSCPLACVRKRVLELGDLVHCAACACVRRLRGGVFCTSDVVSDILFCGMLIHIAAGAYSCGPLFGCGRVRDLQCFWRCIRVCSASMNVSMQACTLGSCNAVARLQGGLSFSRALLPGGVSHHVSYCKSLRSSSCMCASASVCLERLPSGNECALRV